MPSFGENIISIILYLIYIANPYVQASEVTHYIVIAISEEVEPLKFMSTHLRRATFDLIPEVE